VTVTIRPAREADLPSVGDLHVRSRNAAYEGIVPAEALAAVSGDAMGQWWAERWSYERDTHRLSVAAYGGGAVVGFTYAGHADTPGMGELYAIHVHPDHQRTGIGQALMAAALRTLAGFEASRAVLWVLAANAPAHRFYERAGWVRDAVERESPIGRALTRQVRYSRGLDDIGRS